MHRRITIAVLLSLTATVTAQHDYVPPTDPLVQQRLAQWRDLKFGMLIHWGTYSQWGIVESWTLCSEDQPWCSRKGANYVDYKRRYVELRKTFNPTAFDPTKWAKAARSAGMKYVVFTTKHHDGFSMFDTRQTDYRITGPDCPFANHPKANVAKEIFDAFRDEGLWAGVYFSKPDWHHPDYWAPEWATPNRCNNYDTRKYPKRWQRFRDFTHSQIEELMKDYGPIHILWLDGGWVRPNHTITDEVRKWGYRIPAWEQDIDMPRIAKTARRHQPGLIIVDRSVHGPYENYRTPEQHVPKQTLTYPWETCMTMSGSWSYARTPKYKSPRRLIHHLVDIVAKGGNLLLNVGPGPDGRLDAEAYDRLTAIADWMRVNAESIYGTKPIPPHVDGPLRFTQKGDAIYATYLAERTSPAPPARLVLPFRPAKGCQLHLLGRAEPLAWRAVDERIEVQLTDATRAKLQTLPAWVIRIQRAEK